MDWLILILIALLFGAVEGITEWLPVSSTGHMILLEGIFSSCGYPLSEAFPHGSEFWNLFLVVVQLGAILAIVVLFWGKLWPFGKKRLSEAEEKEIERDPSKEKEIQKRKRRAIWVTWLKTLVGVAPAAVAGLVMELLHLDDYLNSWAVVSLTLILYGAAFLIVETLKQKQGWIEKRKDIADLGYLDCLYIGLFQILALIPGTSRSGVTILGALLLGCSRSLAAEYSFYLSIPVMIGASLLKSVRFFLEVGLLTSSEIVFLFLGMIVALIASFFCVKWLLGFVRKRSFKPFGVYRIALGAIMIAFFLATRLSQGLPLL